MARRLSRSGLSKALTQWTALDETDQLDAILELARQGRDGIAWRFLPAQSLNRVEGDAKALHSLHRLSAEDLLWFFVAVREDLGSRRFTLAICWLWDLCDKASIREALEKGSQYIDHDMLAEGAAAEERAKAEQAKRASAERIAAFNAFLGSVKTTMPRVLRKTPASLDESDFALARMWGGGEQFDLSDSSPFSVRSKMLSARVAEKTLADIYKAWNRTVTDVAASQLKACAGDWLTHDLVVDARKVDVKNTRRGGRGSIHFAEHCVKKPFSPGVVVAGMVSPLRITTDRTSDDPTLGSFVWIGEVEPNRLRELEAVVDDSVLSLDFRSRPDDERAYLPAWLYEYPDWVYTERDHAAAACPDDTRLEDLVQTSRRITIPALCLALDRPLPADFEPPHPWVRSLLESLRSVCRPRPSRPKVYLVLLVHFLRMITANREDDTFSPDRYRDLLFLRKGLTAFPLAVLDPLKVLHGLVTTMTTLWNSRHAATGANLRGCRQFRLTSQGILQARPHANRHWQTVLAYCHRCKKQPLVLGIDNICDCGGLRCHFIDSTGERCGACKCRRAHMPDKPQSGDDGRPAARQSAEVGALGNLDDSDGGASER